MRFEYNDGGRKAAGYQGKTGDCVCRSIAIATKMPYAYVYMLLNEHAQEQRITKRQAQTRQCEDRDLQDDYQADHGNVGLEVDADDAHWVRVQGSFA